MNIASFGGIKDLKDFFARGGAKRKILSNFFWLASSEFLTRLLKFILIVYVARILGAAEYGKITFAMAFAGVFFIFSDLGLSQITTREFASDPKKERDLSLLMPLQEILALATAFLIFASSFFITGDWEMRALIWIMGLMIISESLMGFILSLFQARQKMEYLAFAKVAEAVIVTCSGFYVLFRHPSVFNLGLCYLFAALSVFIGVFFLFFRGSPGYSFSFNPAVWKRYLAISWPLALNVFFVSLYTSTDSIMMGYFGQITQTGWYNAAQRIIGISLIPASLMSSAFFPALSDFFSASKEKFQKTWGIYFNSVVFLALPIFAGGFALAPKMISFVYGQGYSNSVLAFQILILMAGISMIASVFSQTLVVFNCQKNIFWVTLFGTILNIALNAVLIPKYSLYGAGWATVATFSAVLALLFIFVRRSGKIEMKADYLLNFIAAAASAGIMYAVIVLPSVFSLNLLLAVSIGFLLYSSVYLFFRAAGRFLAGKSEN